MLKHDKPKVKNGCLQGIKDFHCLDSSSKELDKLHVHQTMGQLQSALRTLRKIHCASQKLLLLMCGKSY